MCPLAAPQLRRARRELRFGWLEPAEEVPAPAHAARSHACLAVYQLPDVPRPDITLQ